MPCERCEKAGDLMCATTQDGVLLVALHPNHTVTLNADEPGLLKQYLMQSDRNYAVSLYDAANILANLKPGASAEERDAAIARSAEDFRYMRWYNVVSGAVREWMRANGHEVPPSVDARDIMARGPRPTQALGRA